MTTWTQWTDVRPPKPGIYLWRLPSRDFGGLMLRPEFANEVVRMGMGYAESELWPRISHWDGYKRTVPAGLEWREQGGLADSFINWGVDLASCPFCGEQPKISAAARSGSYTIVGPKVYELNVWWISCRNCGMAESRHSEDFKSLVARWNSRIPTEQLPDLRGAIGEAREGFERIIREIDELVNHNCHCQEGGACGYCEIQFVATAALARLDEIAQTP